MKLAVLILQLCWCPQGDINSWLDFMSFCMFLHKLYSLVVTIMCFWILPIHDFFCGGYIIESSLSVMVIVCGFPAASTPILTTLRTFYEVLCNFTKTSYTQYYVTANQLNFGCPQTASSQLKNDFTVWLKPIHEHSLNLNGICLQLIAIRSKCVKIDNRSVVEGSPHMQKIGFRSPFVTDLTR